MTAGRQNIWHEVRAVCIFALLYCTLNGAISQGKHTKRSGIMEMRRLQYIQTKQLKSQYLMQLLLCKRRMYNQLYFGRGKPAPLRKARVIEQMRNHISTQMIAVRKASGIVQMPNHISTQTIAVRKASGIVLFEG